MRALPNSIEVNVKGGLLESYSYEALKPGLTGAEAEISLSAAGL